MRSLLLNLYYYYCSLLLNLNLKILQIHVNS